MTQAADVVIHEHQDEQKKYYFQRADAFPSDVQTSSPPMPNRLVQPVPALNASQTDAFIQMTAAPAGDIQMRAAFPAVIVRLSIDVLALRTSDNRNGIVTPRVIRLFVHRCWAGERAEGGGRRSEIG